MRGLLLLLMLAVGCSGAQSHDEQYAAIDRASASASKCKSSSVFDELFLLAASGKVTGVHTSEELSLANENAFLRCPYEFLLALKAQPEAAQTAVVNQYFGIRHAPWELGKELRKLQENDMVGDLVRTRFSGFLAAEAPK